MKILLDTHCWLWWITTPEKLAPEARQFIGDGHNEIFLSAASSWEIAIKYALGSCLFRKTRRRSFRQD